MDELKDKYIRALEDLRNWDLKAKDLELQALSLKNVESDLAATKKQLSDERRRVAALEETVRETNRLREELEQRSKKELEEAHERVSGLEKMIEDREVQKTREKEALREELEKIIEDLEVEKTRRLEEKEEEIKALREVVKQLKSRGHKKTRKTAKGPLSPDGRRSSPSSDESDSPPVSTTRYPRRNRKPVIWKSYEEIVSPRPRREKPISPNSAPPSANTRKRTRVVPNRNKCPVDKTDFSSDSDVPMSNNPGRCLAFTDVMDRHFPHLTGSSDRNTARDKLRELMQKHRMKDVGMVQSEVSRMPSKAVPLQLLDEFLGILRREFGTDEGNLSADEDGAGNICLRSVLRAARDDGGTDDESGADWDSNNVAIVIDNTPTAANKRFRDESPVMFSSDEEVDDDGVEDPDNETPKKRARVVYKRTPVTVATPAILGVCLGGDGGELGDEPTEGTGEEGLGSETVDIAEDSPASNSQGVDKGELGDELTEGTGEEGLSSATVDIVEDSPASNSECGAEAASENDFDNRWDYSSHQDIMPMLDVEGQRDVKVEMMETGLADKEQNALHLMDPGEEERVFLEESSQEVQLDDNQPRIVESITAGEKEHVSLEGSGQEVHSRHKQSASVERIAAVEKDLALCEIPIVSDHVLALE
ncbi:hypothetical protein HK104_005227 [Borealophlyctis nickersoniae]|nr:hypothetical protein HK104_005227 [Borealophlyctis nickersoniae]